MRNEKVFSTLFHMGIAHQLSEISDSVEAMHKQRNESERLCDVHHRSMSWAKGSYPDLTFSFNMAV